MNHKQNRFIYCLIATLLLVASVQLTVCAQAYSAGTACLNVPKDKKSAYYQRNSSRAEKSEDYQAAAIYGMYRLHMAKRKKQIAKATEELALLMPRAVVLPRRIEVLDSLSQVVVGERTIADRHNLRCEYQKFGMIREAYEALAEGVATDAISAPMTNLSTYEDEIAAVEAAQRLTGGEVAELYYRQAISLGHSNNRRSALERLKLVRRGRHFADQHAGLDSLQLILRDRAMGRVAVQPIRNTSGARGEVINSLQKSFGSQLNTALAQSPYFTLAGGEANVSIQLQVSEVSTEKNRKEPTTKERKKELENGKVVTAKFITHSKSTDVRVSGSYKIVDEETGATMSSGDVAGSGSDTQNWYSYTGNKQALKKRDIRRLSSEPAWASPLAAQMTGFHNLGKHFGQRVGGLFESRSAVVAIPVFSPEIIANTYTTTKR